MKVTSVQAQRKNRERVSVFLDEEFWTGMSSRLLEDLDLRSGQEISAERVAEIETMVVEDYALSYAFDRLAARPLSEYQLAEKLRGRELSEPVVSAVIERCRDLGLLDDRYYAETLAAERRDRGQGRRRVADLLRRAGIPDDMAAEALDETFQPAREAGQATEALESRYGDRHLDPAEQRRAYGMLLRRGFSSGAARDAVARVAMDPEEEENAYGWEAALEVLQRRFRSPEEVEKNKAWAYLARRSFSPAAIREALARFY